MILRLGRYFSIYFSRAGIVFTVGSYNYRRVRKSTTRMFHNYLCKCLRGEVDIFSILANFCSQLLIPEPVFLSSMYVLNCRAHLPRLFCNSTRSIYLYRYF